jgi:hypothetical protein
MKTWFILLMCFALPARAGEFTISGYKLGDKVHDIHAYGACLPPEGKLTECINITDLAGGEVFITYFFEGDVLKDANIIFDSKKFGKLVSYYEKQLGEPIITKEPIEFDGETKTNKVAKWQTQNGEFIIQKYKSYKRGFARLKS